MNGHPMIVRVAGLPSPVMSPFSSSLATQLDEIARHDADLEGLRSALAERLHAAIKDAPQEVRRTLLDVKRDSFNGRELRARRHDATWPLVRAAGGEVMDRIVTAEELRETRIHSFQEQYRQQKVRERTALVALLDNPELLRGIALSSLSLADQIPRLRRAPADACGRRERRLAASLLRYVSRAALKLSPFSTLTRVGLGQVTADSGEIGLQLLGLTKWRAQSRVCLRRYVLDQLTDLVSSYPPFRHTLVVRYNDTAERTEDHRYRFLTPGCWVLSPATGEFESVRPAMVKVRIQGPLPPWLERHLSARRWTYGELLTEIPRAFPTRDAGDLRNSLDTLLKIGLVRFLPPWSSDEPNLERRVLEHLNGLPKDPELQPLTRGLEEITRLLDDFPAAEEPAREIVRCKTLVQELLQKAVSLSGALRPPVLKAQDHYFLEDVFLSPSGEDAPAEVVRVAESEARKALYNLEPLARLSNLDSSRHDFLHSLAALAAQRWPGCTEVELAELFDAAQPLFREFIRFEAGARAAPALLAPVFNPLALPQLARLGEWRKMVSRGLGDCIESRDGEQLVCREAFSALLDTVPGNFAAPRDFCAFVQPLNDGEDAWVLNRLFEGAGRLSSRYTPLMDEHIRHGWTSYYTQRAVFKQDDVATELVDLFCPAGHTINVHAPQTQRVIEIPSETSSLPEERRLRLRDLRIRLLGPDRPPQLIDVEGTRILPVHLGGLVFRFMPNLLKFLALFGPGEFRYCLPRRNGRRVLDSEVFERHRIGNVVIVRKTWIVRPANLADELDGLSDAAVFTRIHRWRTERGLPNRIFVTEPLAVGIPAPRKKPQYIDFTSPSFVEIFRSIMAGRFEEISLVEALPVPEQMPLGQDALRWAVEIQLDNFGLTNLETRPTSYFPSVVEGKRIHPQPVRAYSKEI